MNEAAAPLFYSPSSLTISGVPWVFTQREPLTSDNLKKESKKRGFDLDLNVTRDLYKYELLVPLFYLGNRSVSEPISIPIDEPSTVNTFPNEYRLARSSGRLQDLAASPFRPRLQFRRTKADPSKWWNGLLYSQYQLLILSEIGNHLRRVDYRRRNGDIIKVLRKPPLSSRDMGAKFRGIALALTALEARYLPNLDREWVHLSNTDHEEWDRYRAAFDPIALSKQIGYSADQASSDAQFLLMRANTIDPLDRNWRRIVRRTSRDTWKTLKNDALLAMDLREAAEILLRFYEDLVEHGAAEPLPDVSDGSFWHPLDERLSSHPDTLDQDPMRLGLSPHPHVILAVEGESEQLHAPRIWTALGYSHAPELIRVLNLRGADRDLEKVAALAVAPLVGDRSQDGTYYRLIKPPSRLLIAVDPEGSYFGSAQKVEKTRGKILNEIRSVLAAQDAETTDEDLAQTIEIQTWSASCYEFAHFSDDELAAAISAVHQTCNDLSLDDLTKKISSVRSRERDIKEVWSDWSYKVSKVKLAEALWPALAERIRRLRAGEELDVPEMVAIVERAFLIGQNWRRGSFILRARQPQRDGQ